KGATQVIKGMLQLVGASASAFADMIVKTGRTVRTVARFIGMAFTDMGHVLASVFRTVVGASASAWNIVYTNTIGRVASLYRAVVGWFQRLPSGVKSALGSLGSILYSIGSTALHMLLAGLESAVAPIFNLINTIRNAIGSIGSVIG